MIINITKSKLFTIDPDKRFSQEYQLPEGTWHDLWLRFTVKDYTNSDMRDYLFLKHIRRLEAVTMNRWIMRAKIYSITKPLVKMGVEHVNSNIFGESEEYVMRELTKTIKEGSSLTSDSII